MVVSSHHTTLTNKIHQQLTYTNNLYHMVKSHHVPRNWTALDYVRVNHGYPVCYKRNTDRGHKPYKSSNALKPAQTVQSQKPQHDLVTHRKPIIPTPGRHQIHWIEAPFRCISLRHLPCKDEYFVLCHCTFCSGFVLIVCNTHGPFCCL